MLAPTTWKVHFRTGVGPDDLPACFVVDLIYAGGANENLRRYIGKNLIMVNVNTVSVGDGIYRTVNMISEAEKPYLAYSDKRPPNIDPPRDAA